MMMIQSIGATRICSEKHVRREPTLSETRLEPSSLDVIALIPYWPQTISSRDIMKKTGLRWCQIDGKLTVIGNRFLVFEDGRGKYSRLRDDLSNCDVGSFS